MAFRRSVGRAVGVLILALMPWILLAIGVDAQAPPNLPPPGAYQPIPNFVGVGAGVQFRQAINDRFSGVQPIAPAVVKLAFANLPTEQDGALVYCTNCLMTAPCSSGGSGAWAMGQNGIWSCGTTGLSPTTDVNFNGHKAINLAAGTVNGDALSFGQLGSQLGAYLQPSVVGISSAQLFGTTAVLPKPTGTQPGQLLVFVAGGQSSSLVVTPPASPGTWTLVRNDSNSTWSQAIYQKVAGNNEPANYTFTLSASFGGAGAAAITTVANQNAITPIDGSSLGPTNSGDTVTIPPPATTTLKDLNLVFVVHNGVSPTLTSPAGAKPIYAGAGGVGSFYYSSPTTASAVSNTGGCCGWVAAQVAIAPATVSGAPAISDTPAGFTLIKATGTPNSSSAANPMTGYSVNGCFNPVAYGADPTGLSDSSAAFNAASKAACAAYFPPIGSIGTVCIPAGTYLFYAPWLEMCPSTNGAQEPNIVGAGATATVLLNKIGAPFAIGGGPLLELAAVTTVSALGGTAALVTPGLTASGGNSFTWAQDSTGLSILFNLDQIFGDQKLNGLAQFDHQVIFTTTNNNTVEFLAASDGSAQPNHPPLCGMQVDGTFGCHGAYGLWLDSGVLKARINTSVTGNTLGNVLKSASALAPHTTYIAELSYDGTNVRLFHGAPGATSTMDAKVAQTGTISQRVDENWTLGANVQYWNMTTPGNWFKGSMDSVRVSNIARCANDAGCSIPNAKLTGDSNTILLENWSNVSSLPLVEPEYTNGQATDHNTAQSWMAMYNEGLGASNNDLPTLRDFAIRGGTVGIHANTVAPHLQRIDMSPGPLYAVAFDQIADYGATIDDTVINSNILDISIVGGLSFLTRLTLSCNIACIETNGDSIRDVTLIAGTGSRWPIIINGPTQIQNVVFDTESGGNFTGIQVSSMGQAHVPNLDLSGSEVDVWGAGKAPITIDGIYGAISIKDSFLDHGGGATGPFVDVSSGDSTGNRTAGITFDNDIFDAVPEPTDVAGNSYVTTTDSLGSVVGYIVLGGGSTRQTTLNGTTVGTFVWSMPSEGSSYKRFVGHYTGYENTTATAQTITYPVAFSLMPKITTNDVPSGSTSTTAFTLPASMTTPVTGWIIVEGY